MRRKERQEIHFGFLCVEKDFNKVFDFNKTKPGEFHMFELELQSKVHV